MISSRTNIGLILGVLTLWYLGSGNLHDSYDHSSKMPSAQPEVADSAFTVFDGTRFRNKPDMSQYGFKSIEIIYAMRMWSQNWKHVKKDLDHLPSHKLVSKWAHKARQAGNKYVVLDIEHWPNHGNEVALQKSLDNYLRVLRWFKETEPNLKTGYFSVLPIKKRYMRTPPDPHYFHQWQGNNDKLSPLAEQVDAFFPHLYTYSNDQQQWVTNARYTIQEAKRYNGDKPVYVFLWPQYYSIDHPELKDEYIDKDFWRLQLQTARKYADGIVIWFPYKTQWKEASQAPWWNVTKKFLQGMGKESAS